MSVSPGPLWFPQVHGGLGSNDRQPLRSAQTAKWFSFRPRGEIGLHYWWQEKVTAPPLRSARQ